MEEITRCYKTKQDSCSQKLQCYDPLSTEDGGSCIYLKGVEFPEKSVNVNQRIESLMSEEGRSATKKFDYIKVLNSNDRKYQVVYGNGLSCKSTGRSPLTRNFIMRLEGDSNEEIFESMI